MTSVLSFPVQTVTMGKYRAMIIGVEPTDGHPIKGTIIDSGETIEASWDEEGYCLDQLPECNLDTTDAGLVHVIKAARKPGV